MIQISSTSLSRSDSLFEEWFDFTAILDEELTLAGKIFNNNSIRIVEYDEVSGEPIVHNSSATGSTQHEVPYSLWYDVTYNALTNARVKISWVLNGTTPAYTNRTYCIYFDTTDHGTKNAPSYWVNAGHTFLNENELIRSSTNTKTSVDLWSINSTNVRLYVSNSTGDDATLQGQPTRMRYIAGGSTISNYRYNFALMDYSQVKVGVTA